jgi:deoxyribonuclease-4
MTKSTARAGAAILFGTAGPPETADKLTTAGGVREVARLGLDTMEVEYVKGVKMGVESAFEVDSVRRDHGDMPLSAHAPYYINLASPEPEKRAASIKRIMDAAHMGALCGADQVVFHPGFYTNQDPAKVQVLIREAVRGIRETLDAHGLAHVILRPELTGKAAQFGSPDELFALCRGLPRVLPCLDFSHQYTRTLGRANSYDEFARLLERMAAALGPDSLAQIHGHLSGIEYGEHGERRHLNMSESGMDFKAVLKALHNLGCRGRVICESPDRGRDARMFKSFWKHQLRGAGEIHKPVA